MIYTVHFYYSKIGSRKASGRFEGAVFALNEDHAEELINKLIAKYHIKVENFSIAGGALSRESLEEIYEERHELAGISPEQELRCMNNRINCLV